MKQVLRREWLPGGQHGAFLPARDCPLPGHHFTVNYIINPYWASLFSQDGGTSASF